MATFLQAADRMPGLSGDSQKDIKSLHDYVYSLQETIRYVLGNIGEENLDEDMLQSIKQSGKYASEIKQLSDEIILQVQTLDAAVSALDIRADGIDTRVSNVEGSTSQISQKVDGITLSVQDYYGSTYISLTSQGVQIGSAANVTSIVDGVISTKELVAQSIKGNVINIYDSYGYYYGDIEVASDSLGSSALAIWGPNGLRGLSAGNLFLAAGMISGTSSYAAYLQMLSNGNVTLSANYGTLYLTANNGIYANGTRIG